MNEIIKHPLDTLVDFGTPETHADLIVRYLAELQVDYVFGVPGGAIEALFDSLARWQRRHDTGPRAIVARHEAGAAYMADGYARDSGKIGVCCATTGPGSTNLITGVASAYADGVPMLVITPQTALPNFGRRGLQESSGDAIDIVGMFSHCTRYNSFVSHPAQLQGKLFSALATALSKPNGPAHLSIPIDILSQPLAIANPDYKVSFDLLREHEAIEQYGVHELSQRMLKARRIVLFIGYGCRDAIGTILEVAETLHAPIVATPSGKGLINAFHPLFHGVFGFAGHRSARNILQGEDVDMVLAVGTGLDELETSGWDSTLLQNSRLVHIESSVENFTHSPMAQLHLFGNIKVIFSTLLNELRNAIETGQRDAPPPLPDFPDHRNTDRYQTDHLPANVIVDDTEGFSDESTPIAPQRLMRELVTRFPRTTRFVTDAGNSWAWATHYLHPDRSRHYHIGMGFGAMGWAIGAAVGIAAASPDKPVVCLTGDGSYLMSAQEITVALQHNLPVVYAILNDRALGMVKHGQRLGGGEPIGYELPPIDFAMQARSLGVRGYTIQSIQDFARLDLESILDKRGPVLLDIRLDPEAVPPMGARMRVLRNAESLN